MTGESTFGIVDDVSQQYDGNLLYSSNDLIADMSGQTGVYNRFSDNGSVDCDYVYDANGNMIADANRGMSLTYNYLALPETIEISGQGTIRNCYDALGVKKNFTYINGIDTTKVEYLNGIIYKDGLPKQVLTETGYLSLDDNVYRFYIKDYLGSTRLVKNSTGTVEEINNYYPSGALFTVPVPDVQDYKYSGKELVDYANLGWYDYGARYYDPVLMRWHSADPLLEKYYDTSPYSFCSNNFVNFVDPDGKDIYQINTSGHIVLIDETDKVHQLYLVDQNGNRTGDMINLSNSDALESLSKLDANGNSVYETTSGIDNIFKIFKFAADNTNVEWAVHRGQGDEYLIGTSHNEGEVDKYHILAGKSRDELPVASIHSHPDIPANNYDERYSMRNDWDDTKYEVNTYEYHHRMNYVYFPNSKNLYHVEYGGVRYIRCIGEDYRRFYFGTLNHK